MVTLPYMGLHPPRPLLQFTLFKVKKIAVVWDFSTKQNQIPNSFWGAAPPGHLASEIQH